MTLFVPSLFLILSAFINVINKNYMRAKEIEKS